MKKRLIIDVQGLKLTEQESLLLENDAIGGLIFFSRNYQDKQQLTSLIESIKAIRPDILLTVDQEGGRVQRFKQDFSLLPALQLIGDYAKQHELKESESCAWHLGWLMAAELISIGIDCSYAPVVDVDSDYCSVIANRAFGNDATLVTQLARAYINGMNSAGMAATLKHFPGHGVVTADSHLELPVCELSLAQVKASALVPFQELLTTAQAVMVGHLLFPKIDPNVVGYSDYWLNTILRDEIGFDGLIFSDDLSMKGAESGQLTIIQRAQMALNAGCDMILICNDPNAANLAIEWLNKDRLTINSTSDSEKFNARFQSMLGRAAFKEDYKSLGYYHQSQHYLKQLLNQ